MPTPDAVPNQCIVFLTHVWSPAVARHFERLKTQAGRVLPVYLAFQVPEDGLAPDGVEPDLSVRLSDVADRFPHRYAAATARSRPWGYVDLLWFAAFLNPLLERYEHFWLVEYDVDFSGDWADFFAPASTYEGDLLAARVHRLSQNPEFFYADSFRRPTDSVSQPLIAFFPISRLSRRAISAYEDALAGGQWDGHFEILLPTVVELRGLHVADIGGHGPFTPPDRWSAHYSGCLDSARNDGSTHGYRPPRGFAYFVDRPHRFGQPDRIYHPIKSDLPLKARVAHNRRRLQRWWVRLRDMLTGRRAIGLYR